LVCVCVTVVVVGVVTVDVAVTVTVLVGVVDEVVVQANTGARLRVNARAMSVRTMA